MCKIVLFNTLEEKKKALSDRYTISETNYYDGTPCWEWQLSLDKDGYGRFKIHKKGHRAHRVAYEVYVEPLSSELVIDHLCRNRACCNPMHLEAVTSQENILRGELTLREKSKTHCPQGHEYNEENTHYTVSKKGTTWRQCRACWALKRKKRKAKSNDLLGYIS